MYLALRPPWGGGTTTQVPIDAGVVSQAPGDAGTGKPKKKKRRPPGTIAVPGQTGGSDEEYYEDSVSLLCLLSLTGTFWDPTLTLGD